MCPVRHIRHYHIVHPRVHGPVSSSRDNTEKNHLLSPPVTCPSRLTVQTGRGTRGSTPRDPRSPRSPRIPLDVTSASEPAARADTKPTTANNTDDVDGTARRTRLIEGAKHWRVRRIRDDARRTPDATRDGAPTTPARSCVAYVDATYVRQARFRRLYAVPVCREIRK